MSERNQSSQCSHCQGPIPADAKSARFCCSGCESVHDLLLSGGLGRYYELAGNDVTPAAPAAERSFTWLEPQLAKALESASGGACSLVLDVQGVHCAACVWLMNETFHRRPGAHEVTVNPAVGQVALVFDPTRFGVEAWLKEIERFGYQFGPARKEGSRRSIELPLRLGICAAITVNVMLFSLSFYFGLTPDAVGPFELFTWLSLVLSTVTVIVGGWPFFRAAWLGIRAGVLHLDVPIALGIALVYGMSLVQLRSGRGDLTYFDTLNTFITLMLLGRFLQERMLERNRRFLLDDDGADALVVRKIVGERIVTERAPTVRSGEVLLVAPGDVVPVNARLVEATAQVSTDWITGESAPRQITKGGDVPAGSFNAGRTAFHVEAAQDFSDSPLVRLLRQPAAKSRTGAHHALWDRLSRRWVVKVLLVASAGFLAWLPSSLDDAVNVAASLLVITCPCAIGIAIPLAYELMQTRLRRAGFFARANDVLDRLTHVRTVLFDKTGTLTLGTLELVDDSVAARLSTDARAVAWNLAVRSSHPVSGCVAKALDPFAPAYDTTAAVVEVQGQGLEWRRTDGLWRLGRPSFAVSEGQGAGAVLSRDGVEVARFETREALRHDARDEMAWLASQGFQTWLISGDSAERVAALARTLGVPASHALSSQTPEAKAQAVARLDRGDTLYLGDGVNDSLAFERAYIAGTPAIDRPVMPSRSDFFLVGEGLSPLKTALTGAAELRRIVRHVLTISLSYNVFAVGLALMGKMSPLLAAITMPASTLSLIAFTVISLTRRESTSLIAQRAEFRRSPEVRSTSALSL